MKNGPSTRGLKSTPESVSSHTTDDLKRYLGSLSEDFQHKVSAIGEQFGGINKKLDSHTEMIGLIQEDITVMKMDISELKEDVAIVKSDIEIIKTDLKKKVDYDEFHALSRRVAALEQKSHR